MRIISVGQYIDHKNVTNELFRSPISFIDFDLLIWNPSHLFTEYDTDYQAKHQGYRSISDDDSPKLSDDIIRRKSEIAEMINLGRIVIVILPPPDKCYGKGDGSIF